MIDRADIHADNGTIEYSIVIRKCDMYPADTSLAIR